MNGHGNRGRGTETVARGMESSDLWKDTPNHRTEGEASTANVGHCLGMYPWGASNV